MDTQENNNTNMIPKDDEITDSEVGSENADISVVIEEHSPEELKKTIEEESAQPAPEQKVPAKRGRKKKVLEEDNIEPEKSSSENIDTVIAVSQELVAEEKKTDSENENEPETTEEITEDVLPLENQDTETEENQDKIIEDLPEASETPEAEDISIEPEEEKTAEQEEEKTAVKRGRKKKESTEEESHVPPDEQEEAKKVSLVDATEIAECDIIKLLDITESVLEHNDFQGIKEAMILIRNRFELLESEYEQQALIKDAESKEDEVAEVTESEPDEFKLHSDHFKRLLNKYSRLRKTHNEKLEAEKLRNYDLKKQILEDLKLLVESEETLQKTWEDFKRLQQQWKEIGHVPPNQSQDLWNSFNHLVDLFLDKVKINRELRDLDYRKNLEAKLDICEKIEELLIDESIENAFKRLGELQTLWRETGPVPSDKREEINSRFNSAIDKLKEKRREMYDTFREELDKNLEFKRALIVNIKEINEHEITSARVWGTKTSKVEELMKLWKGTGPVPKKYNEEVWSEFKQEMGRFFAEKKAFFSKMKDELMENYNRKQLLCKQAESMQESTEWKKTTQELIALQNEWKTIGPVPHRYSDSVWKQFRTACDVFFNRKKDFFSNLDKHEEENLKAKKEIIEQMLAFEFGEDNKANLESIKDFQRRFFDTGRVPIKEKDKIQSTFQQAVDGLLNKLKIGKEEKRRFDMKQKLESMITAKSGKEDIKKETFAIASKISKLDADIQLWENNIEFFAKSKNADILTKEFREKIEKAKAELLILKEKQKLMRDMIK